MVDFGRLFLWKRFSNTNKSNWKNRNWKNTTKTKSKRKCSLRITTYNDFNRWWKEKNIIESLKKKVTAKDIVYDFDLMENGGHIKGYKLSDEVIKGIEKGLEGLMDKDYFEKKYNVKDKGILLFAMGDGNHSLATAKGLQIMKT